MAFNRRERKLSILLKISDVLEELQTVSRIEIPRERIEAYESFIPRLMSFAQRTEDRKLVEMVEEFARIEERSRPFYQVEILRQSLDDFRTSLESAIPFVSSEAINDLFACLKRFEDRLVDAKRLALSSVQALSKITHQLNHTLIGRRLEKEIAPDLAKQLGYTPCPNILPDNSGEIEVDFLGEKNTTTSPFGTGRLKRKDILIIESKTTISKSDIKKFSKKLNIIRGKYQEHAANFGYDLKCKAWIFSCYGWTEDLKNLAMNSDIEPFGKDEIERILKMNNLLDRRIPICP